MTAQQDQGSPATPRPSRAIRLTFVYEGEDIRLVGRQELQKRAVRTDSIDTRESRNQSGFWVELQGARNRTLYRRVMNSPIETSVEIPTGDENQPFTRRDVVNPQGRFYLLVPDLPAAESVVLFSSPLDPEAANERAREVARFDIRKAPDDSSDTAAAPEGGAS